jgi:rhamnulokinase
MGVEITEPITTQEALKLQFTNEGSADHGVLLLKNITGLWLLQECVRQWQLEGQDLTWDSVVRAASGARALQSFFDPNNPIMQAGEDIPAVIRGYCAETGQSVPQTVGEIARCIFESLSLKYRSVLASLIALTRRDLSMIRVIGGGVMNASLCQMTADACNCAVVAGPVEASALGNVMVQAIATGHLRDMGEGRAAIAMSFLCDVYEPRRSDAWDEAHARFKQLEVD